MLSPLLCLALWPIASPAAAPQDPVDPLACVPTDALAVLTIKDITGLEADGGENAWYRMSQDQEFAPLLAAVRDSLGWHKDPDEEDVVPGDLFNALHGSFTGYLIGGPEGLGEDVGAGFLFDPGPDSAEFERLYEELIAQQVDESVASYESYAGLELILMEAEPADDESSGSATLFIETEQLFFILEGPDAETVLAAGRTTVDQYQGESEAPGLATSPLLLEARGGEDAPGRVELFVNTHVFLDALPPEIFEQTESEQVQAVLAAMGLSQMTWIHAWMDLGEGEQVDIELSVRMPDEGYVRDWASFCQPVPQHLAGLMPADAPGLVLWGYDVWALYQSIWDLYEEVDSAGFDQARVQLDALSQSIGGVDIEQDLLAQLSGATASLTGRVSEAEWLAAQGALAAYAPGEVPDDLLFGNAFLVSLEDSELVALTVEDLMDFAGMMGVFDPMAIEIEDFQGFEIQTLETPGGGVAAWCFDDNLFIFSTFPSLVRSVLRLRGAEGVGSALGSPNFSPHFAREADASYLALTDSKQMVRTLLEAFRMLQGMLPDPDALAGLDLDNDLQQDDFDWDFVQTQVPAASVADRYLQGTTIATMRFAGNVLTWRISTR